MKIRHWIAIGALVIGGYMSYKIVRAIGLMMGLWHSAPVVQAKALVMDLYPFDEELANAAQGQAKSPSAAPARIEHALVRHKEVQREALKEAKGDAGRAVDLLLAKSHDPDGAQALFEAMRELAPQGHSVASPPSTQTFAPEKGETPMAAEPLFKVKEGEAGIVHVARIAGQLGERMKAAKVNPLDPILLEESIRLMGKYGAPPKPQTTQALVVGGNQAQTVPAIDPVVKGTLRVFFKSGEPYLAAQACRALGRLGDAETAEDLIKHPKDYPGASISDFGKDQVEKWKQNRLKLLRQGRGTDESSYWQSVRLTPKHMDTAIDLARAGDAGAGMAVERNMAMEALRSDDPDTRMAQYIDIRMRFPGTREAWKADAAMTSDAMTDLLHEKINTRTREAYLRALDHDLAIVFSQTTSWRPSDLVLDGWFSYMRALYHHRYENPIDWKRENFESFFEQIEAIFRKHYRKTIVYLIDWHYTNNMAGMADDLSCFARHLDLPAIEHPERKSNIRSRLASQKEGLYDGGAGRSPFGQWYLPPGDDECIKAGHIKSVEDY